MDETLKVIVDFYSDLDRLGPSSDEQTLKALSFVKLPANNPKIADIGCGTGAQTLVLAQATGVEIVAIDFLDGFLAQLQQRFNGANLKAKTLCVDMAQLTFAEQEFDLIWSEGAIYNIGFNKGTRYWNRFLKMNGFLALTEISWLTNNRPNELEVYWKNAYAEIDTVENKKLQLEKNGYRVIATFEIPNTCWTDNYYAPMKGKFNTFLQKWNNSKEAQNLVDESKTEMELYEKYQRYYGYVFYVAQKVENV